jgi:hypothetical protein
MGILPMSPRGVSPLESAGITGKMPVILMGETPMLRRTLMGETPMLRRTLMGETPMLRRTALFNGLPGSLPKGSRAVPAFSTI